MVDIAKVPLNQRIKEASDNLYAAAAVASPGQVVLPVEVFDSVIDILQELIDARHNLNEDLESAYEAIGEEISDSAGLMAMVETQTQRADELGKRVVFLQGELDAALAKKE